MSQEVSVIVTERINPKKYCCLLLNELSKGIEVINQEFQRLQMLENEYNKKLQAYLEISRRVDKKLCNIWEFGTRILESDYNKAIDIHTFTNQTVKTWQEGNAAIAKDVQNVLIVSYTKPNAPLDVIVEQIVSSSNRSKDAFQKISPHIYCMGRFSTIHSQVLPLIERLKNGNLVLQYFLSINRGIPHLTNLENNVDQYIMSTIPSSLLAQMYQTTTETHSVPQNVLPQTVPRNEELSAYTRVVQLLNGELLAEENPLHHHSNIVPLVSEEYILPDTISDIIKTPETDGDIGIKLETLNETTRESRDAFGNKFSPNETTTSVMNTSQNIAPEVTRNDGSIVPERPTSTIYKLIGTSSLSSSIKYLLRPKVVFQMNDRKDLNRRRNMNLEAEASDLKPIKMPRLKTDLLTPLP